MPGMGQQRKNKASTSEVKPERPVGGGVVTRSHVQTLCTISPSLDDTMPPLPPTLLISSQIFPDVRAPQTGVPNEANANNQVLIEEAAGIATPSLAGAAEKFLQRFWDSRAQLRVKRDLEHGHFKASQLCNRSEYVMQLYSNVTMLAEPPSEAVAVECFSRHFDEQVHVAVLSQGVRTTDGLILLLDALDQTGTLNCVYSATPQTRPNSPDPHYSNKGSDLARPRVSFESPSRSNTDYQRRDRSPNFQRSSNENRGYKSGNSSSFSPRPPQQVKLDWNE